MPRNGITEKFSKNTSLEDFLLHPPGQSWVTSLSLQQRLAQENETTATASQ